MAYGEGPQPERDQVIALWVIMLLAVAGAAFLLHLIKTY